MIVFYYTIWIIFTCKDDERWNNVWEIDPTNASASVEITLRCYSSKMCEPIVE